MNCTNPWKCVSMLLTSSFEAISSLWSRWVWYSISLKVWLLLDLKQTLKWFSTSYSFILFHILVWFLSELTSQAGNQEVVLAIVLVFSLAAEAGMSWHPSTFLVNNVIWHILYTKEIMAGSISPITRVMLQDNVPKELKQHMEITVITNRWKDTYTQPLRFLQLPYGL